VKTLEVRRHSVTKKGPARQSGSLLSGEGVLEARRRGELLPAAKHVLTGPDRRHVETAIAMGYAVDATAMWPSGYVSGVVDHHDQWRWVRPFERYAELLDSSAELREVADQHLAHWLRALEQVGELETALVVSSGGSIEPVLVAANSGGDLAAWGRPLNHLEGATLSFDGGRCVDVTVQRWRINGTK
jgi:hypothetical protein